MGRAGQRLPVVTNRMPGPAIGAQSIVHFWKKIWSPISTSAKQNAVIVITAVCDRPVGEIGQEGPGWFKHASERKKGVQSFSVLQAKEAGT